MPKPFSRGLMPARRLDGKSGTAALEFAVVAPVLMLMLIGMVLLGFYFTLLHEVQELASSSARASVAGVTDVERQALAQQFVADYTAASGLLLPADITVATGTVGSPAIAYQVSVTYDLKDTPIPALGSLISLPAATIQRVAQVQLGGY